MTYFSTPSPHEWGYADSLSSQESMSAMSAHASIPLASPLSHTVPDHAWDESPSMEPWASSDEYVLAGLSVLLSIAFKFL